ncbi:MAG TPA: SCO family protein [Steroidobacteraceae bacterium]|nr:SCO family protein [Steroidobacteraceae bacterium]
MSRMILRFSALGFLVLCGFSQSAPWHAIDVSGSVLPLLFRMTRAGDGKQVTQEDYRGRIVLLYFGYTNCPDYCPATMANVADILRRLGPLARRVRVLFIAVDPNRDTLPVLAQYVNYFGSQIDGLRGTPEELEALAGRFHAVYSVAAATKGHPYEVTHSSVIYVFDGTGTARLRMTSLGTSKPDIDGMTADLRRLIEEH